MKRIISILILLTALPSFAQMVPQWKNKFGYAPPLLGAYPKVLILDDSSNSYIFDWTVNYGGATDNIETTCFDPILRKVNNNGQTLWFKNFGTVPCGQEECFDLKIDKFNNLFALYSRIDLSDGYLKTFLSKMDLNGFVYWEKNLGFNGNYYDQTKLVISNSGVLYTNLSQNTINFIYKINLAGNIVDSVTFNSGSEYAYMGNFEVSEENKIFAIYTLHNGNDFNSYAYLTDTTHNIQWTKNLNLDANYSQIIFKNDLNIYAGFHLPFHYDSIRVCKFDVTGNIVWNYGAKGPATFNGTTPFQYFPKLILDKDKNPVFASNTNVNSNDVFFIAKLNSQTGIPLWTFNSYDLLTVRSYQFNIAEDSTGNFYSCGKVYFTGPYSGNNYAIIKISNSGQVLRVTTNNSFLNTPYSPQFIAVTKTNDLVVTGAFSDTINTGHAVSLTIKYSQPVNITPIGNSLPNNFSLSQNYPNPFNPNTTINFQIPKNNFVSLKVYDINGREISQLVNENLNAGEYKINFDANSLPSGVYYYKLTSDNFSETKKMLLIK